MQYNALYNRSGYFLLPWKILEEISRLSMVFHNERVHLLVSNIWTYNLSVRKLVNWSEIWNLMEVSTICTYCLFSLWGRSQIYHKVFHAQIVLNKNCTLISSRIFQVKRKYPVTLKHFVVLNKYKSLCSFLHFYQIHELLF